MALAGSGCRRPSGSCWPARSIVAGLVLLATGRPAVGVVVALMPFVVFLFVSQVVGSLWFKPYRVPSGSMEPTIEIGDRILADRLDAPHVGDS